MITNVSPVYTIIYPTEINHFFVNAFVILFSTVSVLVSPIRCGVSFELGNIKKLETRRDL